MYTYDATGSKLRKRSVIGGATEDRYYSGMFEYDGNTRVAFVIRDTVATASQYADYYPFGMISYTMSTGNTHNKYLYNGKENQDELSLDWYDYGARFYDPQIGRFTTPDPFMEWSFRNTPYNYCFNNPVSLIDPKGMFPTDFSSENKEGKLERRGDEKDPIQLPEVIVTAKGYSRIGRFFRRLWRAITNGGNNTYQKPYGDPWTMIGGQGLENSSAKINGPGGKIDHLIFMNPSAGPKPLGFDPLGIAKSITKANEAVDAIDYLITSDKKIKQKTNGIGEETDANGKSLYVKKYIWNCKGGKTSSDEDIRDTLINISDTAFINKMLTDKFVRIER